MKTFSALLAICARNSPVTGEFPAQRPVTRSFDVFFDLCLNKRLSKQWWGWWFVTPSHLLWHHCSNVSTTRACVTIDTLHKPHNALENYPTSHHSVTEMLTHVHISVTDQCSVVFMLGALWHESQRLHASSRRDASIEMPRFIVPIYSAVPL